MADDLKDAKEAFKIAHDAEQEQRRMSLDDIRFSRLGEQWPPEVQRRRELEGRPCLTLNRMPAFAKQVINDARQNKPSVIVHPVGGGADRESAEIYSGLIRNIEYSSQADVAYDTALEFAVYGGIGYIVVRTDYATDDSFDLDLRIDRVANPFTVYGDPYSTAADSSDWNSAFITDMMRIADFKKRWPKADTSDFDGKFNGTRDALWFQGEEVQVAEWWKRDRVASELIKLSDGTLLMQDEFEKVQDLMAAQGVTVAGTRPAFVHRVCQYVMSGSEVLETNEWKGRYIPIVPVYGEEVNVEGKRHFLSLIHFAKDSQRQYNYWKTTTTELVALAPRAPYIGRKGAFDTDKGWGSANTENHPYLEYDGQERPERQAFAGPPAGAIQEAMMASDDLKNILGIHDASMGAQGNETSGRAIMLRQREGDTSTFNYIDNLSRAIRHVGRILVDLIPKVYDEERIIRCLKEDGSSFEIPLNQPAMQAPQAPQQDQSGMTGMMGVPIAPPQPQMPSYQPAPQQMQQDPMMAGLLKVFDLAAGKYDVTVEVGPSYTTKREESAQQMLGFLQVYPQAAPLIGDLLAKNLDWPGADEVAKRLQAMLPPQIQGQNPAVAQMQLQLQQQDGMAKQAVGQLQQENQELQMQLKDKTDKERIDEYNAATARIVALGTAAKDGITVTQDAMGNMQAIPLQKPPQSPTPDAIINAQMQGRELDLRDRELSAKEMEAQARAHKLHTEAQATQVAQIDVPSQQLAMQQAHHEQLLQSHQAVLHALSHVAGAINQKPTRRQAKAVKQPDGTWAMESIDTPMEAAPAGETLQ